MPLAPSGDEARDKNLKAGDVFIPRAYRIRNSYSNCVWCAMETICWGAAGLKSTQGIKERAVKEGWRGSGMRAVLRAMDSAAIPYSHTFNRDAKVLYDAVAFGTGAYFEIANHALVLVGIDATSVRVIDNNGGGEVQSWSRASFDQQWVGAACFPRLFNRLRIRPCPQPISPSPVAPHPSLNPEQPKEPPQKPIVPPEAVKPPPAVIPPPELLPRPTEPAAKPVDLSPIYTRLDAIEKRLDAVKPVDLAPVMVAIDRINSRLDKMQATPAVVPPGPIYFDLIPKR